MKKRKLKRNRKKNTKKNYRIFWVSVGFLLGFNGFLLGFCWVFGVVKRRGEEFKKNAGGKIFSEFLLE